MADGEFDFWDYLLGRGEYGRGAAVDPTTGVSAADERASFFNTLGNVGGLLMAAGQPMTGAERARYLAMVPGAISQRGADLYDVAQRRREMADAERKRQAQAQLEAQLASDPRLTEAQRAMLRGGVGLKEYAENVLFPKSTKPDLSADVKNYNFYVQQEQGAGRTPKSFNEWMLERRRAGAVQVNMGEKGKGAFMSSLGTKLPDLALQAEKANQTNMSLSRLIDKNTGTFSGSLAPAKISVSQFLNTFGFDVGGTKLDNTREFEAAKNLLVLDFMGAMGGARGFSKEESAILFDAFPKIIDSESARERIAKMLIARNNDVIRSFNKNKEFFEKGIGEKLPIPDLQILEMKKKIPFYNPNTGEFR